MIFAIFFGEFSKTANASLVVNVTSYPYQAKCDGVTDDTAAIQTAVTQNIGTGNIVLVPASNANCMVTGISLGSNTQLEIEGTLFLVSGHPYHLLAINQGSQNVHIWGGGKLDGNRANQGNVGGWGGIVGYYLSNVLIEGLTITNVIDWPINIFGSKNVTLSQMTLTDSGSSVEFAGPGSSNCWADHLTISGINDGAFGFYGGVNGGGISNSVISNSLAGCIGVYNDQFQRAPNQNITISNNICFGTTNPQAGIGVDDGTPYLAQNQNVTIQGNQIFGNGGPGIYLSNVAGIKVLGNTIHGDGVVSGIGTGVLLGANFPGSRALPLDASSNIQIMGNFIYDEIRPGQPGYGILIDPAVLPNIPFVDIEANYIYNNSATANQGIAIGGAPGPLSVVQGNFTWGLSAEEPALLPQKFTVLPGPPILVGGIDGIFGGVSPYIKGWACAEKIPASIQVALYMGTLQQPASQGIGWFPAKFATKDAMAAKKCATGGAYGFQIPLTPDWLKTYKGERVYVYGISPFGTTNLSLPNSGSFLVP
jgi:parallel beta-helix repeat protein